MRKVMAAVAALLMVSAGAVATMAPVSADEVWVQGFQRSGPDAVCQAPADETPWQESFRGQRQWTPSWARWANGGQGGWVCQREVVWATSDSAEPGLCVYLDKSNWALFGPSRVLPIGSPVYSDPDCTTTSGNSLEVAFVYAADGSQATELCRTLYDDPLVDEFIPMLWFCAAGA